MNTETVRSMSTTHLSRTVYQILVDNGMDETTAEQTVDCMSVPEMEEYLQCLDSADDCNEFDDHCPCKCENCTRGNDCDCDCTENWYCKCENGNCDTACPLHPDGNPF